MIADILGSLKVEPMVKGSDYKPTDPGPQPEKNAYHDGDFVPDITKLDLRELYLVENKEEALLCEREDGTGEIYFVRHK